MRWHLDLFSGIGGFALAAAWAGVGGGGTEGRRHGAGPGASAQGAGQRHRAAGRLSDFAVDGG
jgi:hypothetical protein